VAGESGEPMGRHARHWLDCIKSRKRPNAEIEDGHEISVACHLANISMKVGRKLTWDAAKEVVTGDKEATAMLERPYRKPWDDVLRSFKL
jgi:hypothetical protein